MTNACTRLSALLIALFATGWVRAQEIGFTASVDRNSIATGEYVKLTVALTNSQERFEAPVFGGLVVVQGPYESSNFNYVNGRMSSSVSRTWVLTATAPGRYTIGPAKARIGGGIIQTEPITIEVTKGTARPSDPNTTQAQSRDANLFATISLSKTKAYVGEQITATYTLYSRYSNIELSKYEVPKMDGFWAEEIDLGETNWDDQLQTINGLQYRTAVLKRQVIFPQRSGKLAIAPMELECLVNRSFFNRGSMVSIRSNALEITAMPLPTPAPPGFKGAVGELNMAASMDRNAVKANEAIELTVSYSGRGNLKLMEAPTINFPSDMETYDPKVTDKISVNGSGMSGSRTFQYLVIPRHEGEYPLDPVTFCYFDTGAGQYRTIQADPMTIQVSPGDAGAAVSIQRPSKNEVEVLGRDIRYIRTDDMDLRPLGSHLFGSTAWVAGMAAPALAFGLFVGWRRRRDAAGRDVIGSRRRLADSVARKHLELAEKALKSSDRNTFYDAMGRALHGYIADKFALGPAEANRENIMQRLAGGPDAEEIAGSFVRLMALCDMARFAPVDDTPAQGLFDDAAALIRRTEQRART